MLSLVLTQILQAINTAKNRNPSPCNCTACHSTDIDSRKRGLTESELETRQLYSLDFPGRTLLQWTALSALQALARLGINSVLLLCMIWILRSSFWQALLILSLLSHRHLCTRPSPAQNRNKQPKTFMSRSSSTGLENKLAVRAHMG